MHVITPVLQSTDSNREGTVTEISPPIPTTPTDTVKIRIKILTQEHIIRRSTITLTVDLSLLYYQLVAMIHNSLQRDVQGISFESVELYSATGYPLALSPYKYFEQLSKWNLEQNELLCVYPKKLDFVEMSSYTKCKDHFQLKVRIETTDITIILELDQAVIFCCDLKTLISIQLHLPTNIIILKLIHVNETLQNILIDPKDRLQLEVNEIVNEQMLISVQIQDSFYINDTYLEAFKTRMYTSCIPQSILDWDCFNCLLLYLSREQQTHKEQLMCILGLIRRISYSPPLVFALHRLLNGYKLYLPHKVAINEGLITTLSFLISGTNPGIHNFAIFWMYLEKYALREYKDTEVYETQYISKHTRERPRDNEIKQLLQSFPTTEDIIVTWRNCPSAYEPFSHKELSDTEFLQIKTNERFPLKHPIELYQQFLNTGVSYGLVSPPSPGLSSYCVFIGRTKGRYGYFDYFYPNTGECVPCNPHYMYTSQTLQIDDTQHYPKVIVILDISEDMKLGCCEYSAGRDCKEPNLICTSLEMAIRIIELLVDSLIGMSNQYLLGIILISNSSSDVQVTKGMYLLQSPTLEYVKTLDKLKTFIQTIPLQKHLIRSPQGIIINALFFIAENFGSEHTTTEVFLLTNHYSDKKYYGSKKNSISQRLVYNRIVLKILILSERTSHNLSGLTNTGRYIDQLNIKSKHSNDTVPSHYLLEYNSLSLCNSSDNFDTYKRIHSHFRKKLITTEDTLMNAENNKNQFIHSFKSGTFPNIINILRLISNYSRTPNPYCKIYSIQDNILDWMCILQGPVNSPYKDSLLFLKFHFGTEYPRKPPTFRFLSSHYHPNISVTGEVCHPILIEDYHSDISLRQMLDSIYDMLCSPVSSHAVRYKVFEVFLFHKQTYSQLVESFGKISLFKKSLNDCLSDFCVKNCLKSSHPEPFICPLTKELFDTPVMTRGGDTYERCAILQYVKQYQCDPFTKLPLTESDLIPNTAVLSAVHKYKKKIYEKGYWWEQ